MKSKSLHIISFIVSFAFVLSSYAFGTTSSSAKIDSFLFSALEFEKQQQYTHVNVCGIDGTVEYSEASKTIGLFYKYKRIVNPYIKTTGQYGLKIFDEIFDSKICSTYVNSDKKEMECLPLNLFNNNSTISSGPKYGADFAAYIPSSIADFLVEKNYYESYSQILSSNVTFTMNVNGNDYKFSVNNIYLNNNSFNWQIEEDFENNYLHHFSSSNKNAIFSYCPQLFKNGCDVCIAADVAYGFGNLEFFTKATFSNISCDANIELFKNESNEKLVSQHFNKDDVLKHIQPIQIYFLVLLIAAAFFVVLTQLINYKKHYSIYHHLHCCFMMLLVLIAGEITKTVFSKNISVYLLFNSLGNILVFACAVVLLICFVLRKKYEKKYEQNFTSIAI